jgi:hypothetical protein
MLSEDLVDMKFSGTGGNQQNEEGHQKLALHLGDTSDWLARARSTRTSKGVPRQFTF